MLEALLLSLSCTLNSDMVEYKNSAYHSVKEITCPANPKIDKPISTIVKNSDLRLMSLTITILGDKIYIRNELEVERPWIAPIDMFMSIAKTKHNDKLSEELEKILK